MGLASNAVRCPVPDATGARSVVEDWRGLRVAARTPRSVASRPWFGPCSTAPIWVGTPLTRVTSDPIWPGNAPPRFDSPPPTNVSVSPTTSKAPFVRFVTVDPVGGMTVTPPPLLPPPCAGPEAGGAVEFGDGTSPFGRKAVETRAPSGAGTCALPVVILTDDVAGAEGPPLSTQAAARNADNSHAPWRRRHIGTSQAKCVQSSRSIPTVAVFLSLAIANIASTHCRLRPEVVMAARTAHAAVDAV